MSKPETMNMNIYGYIPVYRELGSDEWLEIPIKKSKLYGLPLPALFGPALELAGCYGNTQALAFVWAFAAIAEAEGEAYRYEVGLERRAIKVKASSQREGITVIHPSKEKEDLGEIYMQPGEKDESPYTASAGSGGSGGGTAHTEGE